MVNLDNIITVLNIMSPQAALKTADQVNSQPEKPSTTTLTQTLDKAGVFSRGVSNSSTLNEEEFILTDEFNHALKLITSRAPFVLVTGRAGTGKSTFTRLLKSKLQNFVVVAPTGVAALNVGGQTIHSFFRIPPGPIDFSKIERLKNRRAYQALRVLIIDEISMVRADLMDAIDIMLRRNAAYPGQPFGGVQVVAIGDLYQLPPIIASSEEQHMIQSSYQSPFFFSADCIKQVPFEMREFTRVFRQREVDFIEILNNIRERSHLSQTLNILSTRVVSIDSRNFNGVILTADNSRASTINTQRLAMISSAAHLYVGRISGEFRIDQQRLPAPFTLDLKTGCQVMFVKNDSDKRWVNGTLGVVVELGSDYVNVKIDEGEESRLVRVEYQAWENFKYMFDPTNNQIKAEKIGKYEQLPLMLAWAVTIHKSQGKSFDRVHIDLSRGAFAEGQVYVALSRCRTLAGVTLEKALAREDIRLNDDVVRFMEGRMSRDI